MKHNGHLAAITVVMAALILGACQSPTQAQPTEATGPGPVTSTEDIVGIWEGFSFAYQFNQDGTYYGGDVDELENDKPAVKGEFWFEGTQLYLRHVEVPGSSPCGSETGIYEVQLLENGKLKFTEIEESCQLRSDILTTTDLSPVR